MILDTADTSVLVRVLAIWAGLQLIGAALAWAASKRDRTRRERRTGGLGGKFAGYVGITLAVLLFGWLPAEVFQMVVLTWMTFTILEFHSAVDQAEADRRHDEPSLMGLGPLVIAASFLALYTVRAVDPEGGAWGFLYIVVGTTDAYSQLFGQGWGRRQMAPELSPKKMWEGFAGGTLSGVLAGLAAGFVFPRLAWPMVALVALISSLAGTAGDLLESAVKRHLGIKDFSGLLGSHGGLLDRFDSLLAAALVFAPLAWLWAGP